MLVVLILPPVIVAAIYGRSPRGKAVVFAVTLLGLVLVMEAIFRLGYRIYTGHSYRRFPRLAFESIYVEPHPYIPFIYKRHFKTSKAEPAEYPLHRGRFFFGEYTTNNLGFADGDRGNRDVVVPKPGGLFRVCCLGASTTGNYIVLDGVSHSYPMELEKILRAAMDMPIEVNNCAQGGYNSADIFVRFALQVIDTQPDVVVIYHGYNDVRAYLTRNFEPDYSHARRNLGEVYWKFALAGKLPFIPLKFLNYLVREWIPLDVRNAVPNVVWKGSFDPTLDPAPGLRTYRRNLRHILDLCRSNGISVVLSTYCHFLYDAIKDEPLHLVYRRIVEQENEVVRSLARECGLPLVDNAVLVPQDERYFVDSVHFTPEGMRLIAENVAHAVMNLAPAAA